MSCKGSSSESNEVASVRRKMLKYHICQICDRICSSYNYYGAMCCEACKQFFRRVVAQQESMPRCLYDSKCNVTKVKCRYCRYQKCLLLGMDEKLVKIKSAERCDDLLEFLKPIERAFKKIWDSRHPLPDAYTNRYDTLAGLLEDNYNLLADANHFHQEHIGWDKAQFIAELETNGFFSMHALNIQHTKDWFLVIELAKTFSFFRELELNDQICLLNHVVLPAILLIKSYYSYAMNAKCVTRKNGLEIPSFLEMKQFCGDGKLKKMANEITCNLIEMMSDSDLTNDEFLLLLAILFSNSNADGLSPIGRRRLYNESIRCTKALHKLLQTKFDSILGGSQKFASLMNLTNYSFILKYKFLALFTYIEVFYEKRAGNYAYPSIMQSTDAKLTYT